MAKGSMGLEENVAGLLSYVLGWITGVIFFFVEKESKYVKFHAMQSILFSVTIMILNIVIGILVRIPAIGFIFSIISIVVSIGALIIWILCLIKAYKMEEFKLPIIGDIAYNIANK